MHRFYVDLFEAYSICTTFRKIKQFEIAGRFEHIRWRIIYY